MPDVKKKIQDYMKDQDKEWIPRIEIVKEIEYRTPGLGMEEKEITDVEVMTAIDEMMEEGRLNHRENLNHPHNRHEHRLKNKSELHQHENP